MDDRVSRIRVTHLTKAFQEHKVLKDITFSVRPGEIFGLLGPSGAGKTTLIKILTGQLLPTEGTAELSSDSIGMVMDEAGLYERLTCKDNLQLFAELYVVSPQKIPGLLQKVGLTDALRRPVSKLSKGMTSRLVLARALLAEPEILFLDEPTSGLDPMTASHIHELILKEKEKGTTVFLTTHNMEEATKLCDNVALLNDGDIVEYGNPREICRRYNHQNQIVILKKDGELLILANDETAAEPFARCVMENIIESIHSTEPNLETVFMELTGRGLGN